jgi:hypothetical protein
MRDPTPILLVSDPASLRQHPDPRQDHQGAHGYSLGVDGHDQTLKVRLLVGSAGIDRALGPFAKFCKRRRRDPAKVCYHP